jgi:hypothetical protein
MEMISFSDILKNASFMYSGVSYSYSYPAIPVPPPSWADAAEAIGLMTSAIEKHGWTQGTLRSPIGLCMLGAFAYRNGDANISDVSADQLSLLGTTVAELLVKSIRARGYCLHPNALISDWQQVIWFNDSSTTKEMVLEVLADARLAALALVAPAPAPNYIPDSMLLEPAAA